MRYLPLVVLLIGCGPSAQETYLIEKAAYDALQEDYDAAWSKIFEAKNDLKEIKLRAMERDAESLGSELMANALEIDKQGRKRAENSVEEWTKVRMALRPGLANQFQRMTIAKVHLDGEVTDEEAQMLEELKKESRQ